MSASRLQQRLLARVEAAFRTLPDRYLGAPAGFDVTYHVRLGDVGHTFEVRCTEHAARVRKGISGRPADVVIGTDAETWLRLRAGELSGLEAFRARTLYVRGELDNAVRFEGLFRLPDGRDPLMRVHDVEIPSPPARRVSVLTTGAGPDVLLVHGLGAAKSSFFDCAAYLADSGYRVHALDLPGFGGSSKPARAPYSATWFADTVLGVMDALEIPSAHLAGNSMGGRVVLELGLRAPERVRSIVALCPAVAFVKRDFHPLVRLLRPEFGLLPHKLRRGTVERRLWSMFCDPDALDPSVADVVVDEFQRIYGSAGGRVAFYASARNIYLDRPFGHGGFYPRLAELEPPTLFVWGSHDPLIPPGFRRHVGAALPGAEQIVLQGCGHVPQVERAEQTAGMLRRIFDRAEVTGPRRLPAPAAVGASVRTERAA
ncbi:MAG TPA: alpha/beta fold hydrolase [Baekduia sp.]|uniref:alpha/beta fold hydrolase n=1 Tax=Baekduia sp. TaxID=2600305 RepID=UPI002BF24E71|nr:alpha/beta fold hydrolase [Baekduia sp.]HMJ34024.1 alpha/beta fold hydrolase [Baekduia sp.]